MRHDRFHPPVCINGCRVRLDWRQGHPVARAVSGSPGPGKELDDHRARTTPWRDAMPDSAPDHSTVDALRREFQLRLNAVSTPTDLKTLQDDFLGRKSGRVTGLMKQLGTLPPDARREFGAAINGVKTDIE